MKRLFVLGMITLLCCPLAFIASANAGPVSYDDLWDISQGSLVTAHSPRHWASHIDNMFGASKGSAPEEEHTMFDDGHLAGTVHWVEWMTSVPMTLETFNLVAAHDHDLRDIRYRGFSQFRL